MFYIIISVQHFKTKCCKMVRDECDETVCTDEEHMADQVDVVLNETAVV